MNSAYSIGEFAKVGGVGVETIRYYERRKLIAQPLRPHGRIRKYGDPELEQLRFIKRAQAAGFSLDEVESLLRFQRDQSCKATRQLAATKLREIEARLIELRHLRKELRHWIVECDSNNDRDACPALAALSGQRG